MKKPTPRRFALAAVLLALPLAGCGNAAIRAYAINDKRNYDVVAPMIEECSRGFTVDRMAEWEEHKYWWRQQYQDVLGIEEGADEN